MSRKGSVKSEAGLGGSQRGKAAGVATGPATGSDHGEWSRSGDESPETADSA